MGQVTEQIDRPVVLDNTVLTNLAVVDRADLVKRLWPKAACTTPAIFDEYRVGAVSGLVPADAWGLGRSSGRYNERRRDSSDSEFFNQAGCR
jgi:hypothetical protein